MSRDVNVLALVKGEQRYIFLYTDQNKSETLRTLGSYASDPEIDFSWYDAAVLSQKLRQNKSETVTVNRIDQALPQFGPIADDDL